MRQLSALDEQFLDFETEADVANVAGLAILEREVSRDELFVLLKDRLGRVEQLRQRLKGVPFRLDRPYWVADAEVDLDYHLRELALPSPGNDAQLGEQVARLHERRLDRTRPLWEMYLIQSLAGGRSAVYTKLHHAAIDGLGGADVLASLMDPSAEPERDHAGEPPPSGPDGPLHVPWMLARGALHALTGPTHVLRFLAEAIPHLDEIPVVSRIPGTGQVSRVTRWLSGRSRPELPHLPTPRTPLSGPVSAHRRFAFAELPLDEVKRVKNAFGVTVNDVVLALAATAVRRWLAGHAMLPAEPLIVGVPFALRRPGEGGRGNQVTIMTVPLPTHVADVRRRLQEVHASMERLKARLDPVPASWMREFTESLPAALTGLADRAAFALLGQAAPPMNLIVSNVPGPQVPLFVAGARLLAHYPVSVVTGVSGGLNITVFSYDGRLDVGITACRDMVPDVWAVPGYLKEALEELTALLDAP
ncbi:wax ester/triacylglycerol synthase family O-acyltransferase [Planobispora siamensis]|uniref:Diacylglycerol O-acyltransferase n=1 Tax=Planobispora siamensis TaxID=936338 RepID=A0A8J3WQY2_9ACTN|nr:wax ester/triacylglycerol synthase family O-acyltransferase [Planobispora siamensis]GIH96301.1 diacylglycerol O-acyltransferase [Planobispora siamensis]